jgi:hypothetical protein
MLLRLTLQEQMPAQFEKYLFLPPPRPAQDRPGGWRWWSPPCRPRPETQWRSATQEEPRSAPPGSAAPGR